MTTIAKKYKLQSGTNYPHIGAFLKSYFVKKGINRASLSREIGVADSTSTRYLGQESIQFGILWKMSVALNYNLIADLGARLPIPFASAREKELENELLALQQELSELKIENRTYKGMLSSK